MPAAAAEHPPSLWMLMIRLLKICFMGTFDHHTIRPAQNQSSGSKLVLQLPDALFYVTLHSTGVQRCSRVQESGANDTMGWEEHPCKQRQHC